VRLEGLRTGKDASLPPSLHPSLLPSFLFTHSPPPSLPPSLPPVIQHPYVLALAGISCLYEMVLTILDYEMKVRCPSLPPSLPPSLKICISFVRPSLLPSPPPSLPSLPRLSVFRSFPGIHTLPNILRSSWVTLNKPPTHPSHPPSLPPPLQVIGLQKLSRHPHASEHFAQLMGHFGQATNALSFFFSLLGTR